MKHICLLLLALSLFDPAWAQGPLSSLPTSAEPRSTSLTLEQCITLALENQPALRQSVLQKQVADNTVEQTRKSQLPVISGLTNQGINFGRNVDPYTNGITNAQIATSNAGLGLNWTIFNGFQVKNTLFQQSMIAQASQFDVAAIKNNITLNTLLAYLQVLSAQDLLAASAVQVAVSQAQV
ncbi:MAG: hypothetical protein EOO39_39320, partial [Cytophagaceae bacterium]